MPAKLVGLFRSLTRDDFPTVLEALPSSVRVAAFTSATAARPELVPRSRSVQTKYDGGTHAGADQTGQARWDKAIQASFTTPVAPPRMTPDNAPIKIPLLTALSQAGISV